MIKPSKEAETAATNMQGNPVEFCEDSALTLAERTFNTKIDEQLAEDVIQFARRQYDLYCEMFPSPLPSEQQSVPNITVLVEALEEIIYPIRYMQKRLEEGMQLNGLAAVQLAEDAEYLRDIAKRALATYREQSGGITDEGNSVEELD